jgi:hypothetical protein
MAKSSLPLQVIQGILLGLFLGLTPPFIGGVWYSLCGDHRYEQEWLDEATAHLKDMRAACDDPDLCEILDYTIARYHRAGAWDVMVAPCFGVYGNGNKTIGINVPWCPGITIDPEVLTWDAEDGAIVVVHEALHDYYPYLGHGHINDREKKFYALSFKVKPR